jgi:hypothetical protein
MAKPRNISGAPEPEVDLEFAQLGPVVDEPAPALPPEVRAGFDKAEELMEEEDDTPPPEPIPAEATLPGIGGGEDVLVWFTPPEDLVAGDIKPAMRALSLGGLPDFCDALAVAVIPRWTCKTKAGMHIKPPSRNPKAMNEITTQQWLHLCRYLALYLPHLSGPERKNPTPA